MTPSERVEEMIRNGLNPELKNQILAALESQMFEEREACARKCENWADGQDRMALLKDIDAPASAQSHSDCAIICRRMANAIRKRTQTEALNELTRLTEEYGGYDKEFKK